MTDGRKMKRAAESAAEQVHVLTMPTLNGNGRLSGGQLMWWIDETATVVARRHAESDVTTARVDNLQMLRPAFSKDTVVVKGRIVYVGNSSMEVRVDVFTERFYGEQTPIATAEVLMVALDESENVRTVPGLILETDEEKAAFAAAEKRLKNRKKGI